MILTNKVSHPLISIVIPSFNEKDIRNTIENLLSQTMVKKGMCEIIIVDYDPDNSKVVFNEVQGYEFVKYWRIYTKGISHARYIGCMKARGKYIVNFDADSIFDTIYAIEYLVKPLEDDPNLVFTFCDNIPITDDALSTVVYDQLNKAQRISPVGIIFESGLTIRKNCLDEVGGFQPERIMWEAMELSARLVLNYTIFSKFYVENCSVLTSDRRISQLRKEGLGILNYEKAYR